MKDADGSTWCRVPFARTAAGILRGAPAPALDVQLLISFIKLTSNGTQLSNDGLSGVCGPVDRFRAQLDRSWFTAVS